MGKIGKKVAKKAAKKTGLSYREPAPHNFSFNSPQGACPRCKGLGYVNLIDIDKVIPDKELSIYEGAILPLGKFKNTMIFWQIDALLEKYDCDIKDKVKNIPDEALQEILYGSVDRIRIKAERIVTSSDSMDYKNSIITFMKIDDKEWNRLLRNKKILYKKE